MGDPLFGGLIRPTLPPFTKELGNRPELGRHAGALEEMAPSEEPASFMCPDTTIIGPGEEILLPEQSERVTGKPSSASSSGARRRMSLRRKCRR